MCELPTHASFKSVKAKAAFVKCMDWVWSELADPAHGGPHTLRKFKLRGLWPKLLLRPFPKGNYAFEMERRAELFLDGKWAELFQEYTDARDAWD